MSHKVPGSSNASVPRLSRRGAIVLIDALEETLKVRVAIVPAAVPQGVFDNCCLGSTKRVVEAKNSSDVDQTWYIKTTKMRRKWVYKFCKQQTFRFMLK